MSRSTDPTTHSPDFDPTFAGIDPHASDIGPQYEERAVPQRRRVSGEPVNPFLLDDGAYPEADYTDVDPTATTLNNIPVIADAPHVEDRPDDAPASPVHDLRRAAPDSPALRAVAAIPTGTGGTAFSGTRVTPDTTIPAAVDFVNPYVLPAREANAAPEHPQRRGIRGIGAAILKGGREGLAYTFALPSALAATAQARVLAAQYNRRHTRREGWDALPEQKKRNLRALDVGFVALMASITAGVTRVVAEHKGMSVPDMLGLDHLPDFTPDGKMPEKQAGNPATASGSPAPEVQQSHSASAPAESTTKPSSAATSAAPGGGSGSASRGATNPGTGSVPANPGGAPTAGGEVTRGLNPANSTTGALEFKPEAGAGSWSTAKDRLEALAKAAGVDPDKLKNAHTLQVSDALRADAGNQGDFYDGGRMHLGTTYEGDNADKVARAIIADLQAGGDGKFTVEELKALTTDTRDAFQTTGTRPDTVPAPSAGNNSGNLPAVSNAEAGAAAPSASASPSPSLSPTMTPDAVISPTAAAMPSESASSPVTTEGQWNFNRIAGTTVGTLAIVGAGIATVKAYRRLKFNEAVTRAAQAWSEENDEDEDNEPVPA